jgi:phosphotransferase system  glucose/maltose/N-acetylglucosamine-specific IIC component
MNFLQKIFYETRDKGEEDQHNFALVVAGILTVVVAYFLFMYWYGKFVNVVSPQESIEQVLQEETFLEKTQNKLKNLFKNEQVVNND